jgi:hypothetical protein
VPIREATLAEQGFGLRRDWNETASPPSVKRQGSVLPTLAGGFLLVGLGLGLGLALRPEPASTSQMPVHAAPLSANRPKEASVQLTAAQIDARRQAAEDEEARLDAIRRQKKAAAIMADAARDQAKLQEHAAISKAAIAGRMRDPSSAIYRNVIATQAGTFFCGEVNARNGFGGYGEWVPFIAVGSSVYFPDSPIFASTFQSECVNGWGKEAAPF